MLDAKTAYDRRWWTLATLCVCVMVIGIDNTILNVAIPSIVESLGAHGSQLQWIVDSYVLVFAGMLLTAGSLGDRYGRKKALTFGLVVFAVFSALAAQATSPTTLIIFRGLQGIGESVHLPDHAVDPHQHVHGAEGARPSHRHLGRRLRPRRGDRPAGRRPPARALQLGLRVPRQRARVRAGPRAQLLLHHGDEGP